MRPSARSALPPTADITLRQCDVRKVPQTEVKRQAITSTTLNDIVQSLLNEVSDLPPWRVQVLWGICRQ